VSTLGFGSTLPYSQVSVRLEIEARPEIHLGVNPVHAAEDGPQ